jgi:hypothetical protein
VPLIHEKVRVETEYRKEPVVEREEKVVSKPVHVEVPVVVVEERVVQVPKTEIKVVTQEKPR